MSRSKRLAAPASMDQRGFHDGDGVRILASLFPPSTLPDCESRQDGRCGSTPECEDEAVEDAGDVGDPNATSASFARFTLEIVD